MLKILVSILFLVKTTDSETYMHSEAGKLVLELIAGINVWSSGPSVGIKQFWCFGGLTSRTHRWPGKHESGVAATTLRLPSRIYDRVNDRTSEISGTDMFMTDILKSYIPMLHESFPPLFVRNSRTQTCVPHCIPTVQIKFKTQLNTLKALFIRTVRYQFIFNYREKSFEIKFCLLYLFYFLLNLRFTWMETKQKLPVSLRTNSKGLRHDGVHQMRE